DEVREFPLSVVGAADAAAEVELHAGELDRALVAFVVDPPERERDDADERQGAEQAPRVPGGSDQDEQQHSADPDRERDPDLPEPKLPADPFVVHAAPFVSARSSRAPGSIPRHLRASPRPGERRRSAAWAAGGAR